MQTKENAFQPICMEVDQKNCDLLNKRGFNTVFNQDQIGLNQVIGKNIILVAQPKKH